MARQGRCVNFGNCPRADSRELIEVPESEDFVCPAPCERPLQQATGPDGNGRPGWVKLAFGTAAVALLGVGVWLLMPPSEPTHEPEPTLTPSDTSSAPPAACQWRPIPAGSARQALEHMQRAIGHAKERRHADAQREFESALRLAPDWPGLHNGVATARVALKDVRGARAAIEAELRLIECLRRLDDAGLSALEPALAPSSGDGASVVQRARKQIGAVEAHARYNLACIEAVSNRVDPALAALRQAINAGFRDRQALDGDPDLEPLRARPEFQKLVALIK